MSTPAEPAKSQPDEEPATATKTEPEPHSPDPVESWPESERAKSGPAEEGPAEQEIRIAPDHGTNLPVPAEAADSAADLEPGQLAITAGQAPHPVIDAPTASVPSAGPVPEEAPTAEETGIPSPDRLDEANDSII